VPVTTNVTTNTLTLYPTNFDNYRLIRNREAPATIDVLFLPSRVRPTGFGEIAVPPIAPAIANGIAAATGDRIRRMPFTRLGYDLGVARG
jgi:isoquinoline 1-oxidoreductase beta subunit